MGFVGPLVIVRRFALWLAVCAVSAMPSFMFGRMLEATTWGMCAGVGLFVAIYTLFTSTRRFDRFLRETPFVRSTMYVGYGLRIVLSVLAALSAREMFGRGRMFNGPFAPYGRYLTWPDMLCGSWSIRIVQTLGKTPLAGSGTLSFNEAFTITCVQGAILNVIVFIVMAIVYGLQRAFRTAPAPAHRGFDVLPAD